MPLFKDSYIEYNYEVSFPGKGFDNLPVGAMIVDRSMKITFANKILSRYFTLNQTDIEGVLLGYALQCENAEACGPTSKCQKCAIRKLMHDIYEKTVPILGTEFMYTHLTGGLEQIRWFRIGGGQVAYKAMTYALLSFEDITAYKQREYQLTEMLRLDMATETLNKYSLAEYIDRLGSPGKSLPFTICMINFDDFKKINDYYGHITGDMVINTFAEISRKIIRSGDIIGRYGGEEFVFVFLDTDQRIALNIISRIQSELKTYFSDILDHPVTFSAGLIYIGEYQCQNQQYTDLIDQLDKLLYKAKENGNNCIVSSDVTP